MQKVGKIALLISCVVLIATSGCSVLRRGAATDENDSLPRKHMMYNDILANNIVKSGLYIRKGRVELITGGNRERFTMNLRVSDDGKWLASIRTFAGIEIARIYADKNAVTILDRVGRTATLMEWDQLKRDFGLTYEMLPLLMGDVPEGSMIKRRAIDCSQYLPLNAEWADILLNTDCDVAKVHRFQITDMTFGRKIVIQASGFITGTEGLYYPSSVEIAEESGILNMKLTYEDTELNWKGKIDFEIPAGYRIER
jgi:hypothetical protein